MYVGENETVRLVMQFEHHRGKYMVHCHNLPHEDHDMMHQFSVGLKAGEVDVNDPLTADPCSVDLRAARRARPRTLVTVAVAIAAVAVVRLAVLSPFTVSEASMAPAVGVGDTVLVDRVTPRLTGWHRGDVVTLRAPDGELVLKRIVGLPGETVTMEDTVVVVDGREVPEPYADNGHLDGVYAGPVTVAPGAYFVLGDNRGASVDSRNYGTVREDALTGRLIASWTP